MCPFPHTCDYLLDGEHATAFGGTEPRLVLSLSGFVVKVVEGPVDKIGGRDSCFMDFLLFRLRATVGEDSLVVDVSGGGEITRELDLGNALNSGVQVFGGPIGVDVGEQVRWVDRVVSGASSREIICSRN